MFKLRSRLLAAIAAIAFFLVGCGGSGKVLPPVTYSEGQIQQIQEYIPNILQAKERMADLSAEIDEQDWQEAQAIMRGPLGEMLQEMKYLSGHLLEQDKTAAQTFTRSLFEDFIGIDGAAASKNVNDARRSFDSALRDLDQFLGTVPEAAFGGTDEADAEDVDLEAV